jgi:hypothetical protein
MESKLYDMQAFTVEIRNPFPADCEFLVTLIQVRDCETVRL